MLSSLFFFFNDTATTEIYTLSLHDALPILVLMPFNYNHPVRVAERAAMLDALSGGRLDLGAGRGATMQEMTLCNVDPERTYLEVEESLRMISAMWLKDEFSWDGELNIPPHPILPRP